MGNIFPLNVTPFRCGFLNMKTDSRELSKDGLLILTPTCHGHLSINCVTEFESSFAFSYFGIFFVHTANSAK